MNSSVARILKFYGGLLLALCLIGCLVELPPNGARHHARRASCQSNLKQIGLALQQYTQDYDEKLPSADWAVELVHYLKNERLFQCPETTATKGTNDYFFNFRFLGKATGKISSPNTLVLMGDGVDDGLMGSTLPVLPAAWRTNESSPAWRHLNTANYGFADGHVKSLRAEAINRDFRVVGK